MTHGCDAASVAAVRIDVLHGIILLSKIARIYFGNSPRTVS